MKTTVFIASLAFLLTACGTPSVEDLIENPEKLYEITAECLTMQMQGKDTNTEECINAKEATQIMTKNMMNGLQNDMRNR